ncbi:MAG: hypothetical protein Q4B70_01775 [Lachnospiraceae bacterium]|nr:hypothetical protein [Lachnospiraceae bacterium]
MTVLWILFTAVGFSLHIFIIMMRTGANQVNVGKKQLFKIAVVFSGIQLFMQCAGLFITWEMEQFRDAAILKHLYRFVIFAILIGIGGQRLRAAIIKEDSFSEHLEAPLTLSKISLISVNAGGIAVILGMNMYYYCHSVFAALPVICLSVLSAFAGFSFGYWNGVTGERIISAVSGSMMACLAASMILFAV